MENNTDEIEKVISPDQQTTGSNSEKTSPSKKWNFTALDENEDVPNKRLHLADTKKPLYFKSNACVECGSSTRKAPLLRQRARRSWRGVIPSTSEISILPSLPADVSNQVETKQGTPSNVSKLLNRNIGGSQFEAYFTINEAVCNWKPKATKSTNVVKISTPPEQITHQNQQ